MIRHLPLALLAGAALAAAPAEERKLPTADPVGRPEVVATFDGPMPTGVTVSHKGRVFVNFPRWGDKVDFTVAELKGGKATAYPDAAFNRLDRSRPASCLVSVQSVVIDPDDPYRYAEVRGRVTMTDDPEGELIQELSMKYRGLPWEDKPGVRRLIVRVAAERVFLRG